jgi:hypothetical protein
MLSVMTGFDWRSSWVYKVALQAFAGATSQKSQDLVREPLTQAQAELSRWLA